MKLSKLLELYGDENVIFQTLDSDIKEINQRKGHVEVKFGTHETFNFGGMRKLGLVIWLDRDKVDEILQNDQTTKRN